MKKFYNTQHDYNPRTRFEVVEGESVTIPGESKTIQQMLRRALQGIKEDERPVQWFDAEDLDKIDGFWAPGLDLTDLDALAERNALAKKALDKALKAKAEADKIAAAEAKAAAEKAELERIKAALTDKPNG